MKVSPRCLVLDLDGTVSDSLPDIAAALNRSLAKHAAAPLSLEQVRPMVGDGLPTLYQRGYAARGLRLSDQDIWEMKSKQGGFVTEATFGKVNASARGSNAGLLKAEKVLAGRG